LVLVSVIWTIVASSGLDKVAHRLRDVVFVAIALVVSEAFFIGGALLVAGSLGHHVLSSRGGTESATRLTAMRNVRATYRELAHHVGSSRAFSLGFLLNWVGAAGTGIVLAVGIILVLPVSSWGLLILPLLDLVATFSWRTPLASRLRNARDIST
jgi:hypothetical protein